MIRHLQAAWRARRVLLVGSADRSTCFMQALLDTLGARPARIPATADSETLCRAMQDGRVSVVIVPRAHALAPGEGLTAQLRTLRILLGEAREAGIPLVMLLSDENVYRLSDAPWPLSEDAPLGGETATGLDQAILQLLADGMSRGLLGDAVSTLILRHMPCLGCGHPSVAQYSAWCHALMRDEVIDVHNPSAQGVFLHPADVCLGALSLGARYLAGDRRITGAFNLGPGLQSLMANRSAALRFIRSQGGKRPIRERENAKTAPLPILNGTKARLLCGAQRHIPGDEALSMLLRLEQAALGGFAQAFSEIQAQTQDVLYRLSDTKTGG
ncbi:MAG: hypothetical protein IKK34_03265 [Clostridia bacterium]|nr:hypothetical protein [Clostridia bacterium]